MKRVTPFNAQDLKVAGDAVTLINSYFNGIELVAVIVGVAAVVVWVISMWKRGGQYAGKMRRVLALTGVVILLLPMKIMDFHTVLCRVCLIPEFHSRMATVRT